jgi:hypothetical protein
VSFKKGDVVEAPFPYEEDPTKTKERPCLVMKDQIGQTIIVAQITGTDHRPHGFGFWITRNSDEGISMGLDKNSYLNLKRILPLPASYAVLLGTHPDMPKVEAYCKLNSIKY